MAITPFNTFLERHEEDVIIAEAFNSDPYEITFGKKGAGDVFFTFIDEDDKEFRIQFYTPAGLGKNVRQVFIGQKKGSVYPDAQQRFKNPMKVIATMIEATKQFLMTPIGKGIDGFAINFSRKALERGLTLLPRIIRQSELKQKVNVMDLTYSPDPSRGYVWVIKKGKKPEAVFDGPKMKGITWDNPDKIGDAPPEAPPAPVSNGSAPAKEPDWNISVMAKSNSIESTEVKVNGNDVILSSKNVAISVRDGAMANFAKKQTIAQVTIFDKEFVGRGTVTQARMAKDRQGMGWELKVNGKIAVYVEFGVGAESNSVTDAKWNALVDALNKTYFAGSVKTMGNTAIGQVVKDQIKIIVGMIRSPESVALNFDAYDPDNKQIHLTMSSRRFVDIDVNRPDALTGVVNLAVDVILEISERDPQVMKAKEGKADKEMTQTQWRALQKALFTIKDMTGVSSSTQSTGNVYIPEGHVRVSMLRGIKSTDDPVTITITGVAEGFNLGAPTIVRNVDFTKPAQLVRLIQPFIDTKLDEIRTATAASRKADELAKAKAAADSGKSGVSKLASMANIRAELDKWDTGSVLMVATNLGFSTINPVQAADWLIANSDLAKIRAAKKALPSKSIKLDMAQVKEGVKAMARGGGSDVDWQVYGTEEVSADYDITFRRSTRKEAFREYGTSIRACNRTLEAIATKYKALGFNVKLYLLTAADAAESDERAAQNNGSAYSEYEQSIGGSVKITK